MGRQRLSRPQEAGSLPAKTGKGPIPSEYRPELVTTDRLHTWALTRLPFYLEAYKEAVRHQRWYRRAFRFMWNSWPVMKVRIGVILAWGAAVWFFRNATKILFSQKGATLPPVSLDMNPTTADPELMADLERQDVQPPAGVPRVQVGP